jgi:Tol biopolymer transport system component
VSLPSSGDHGTQDESFEGQSKIKTIDGFDLVGTQAHHICSLQINSDMPRVHGQSSFKSLIFVNDADENVAVYQTNLANDQSQSRSRRQAGMKPSC